ncbi:hypothetical protein MUK42_15817 [Musa troglodytarum]|uniref:Uncharacterized protein n=1 Tax=Musa troglodytarum TaxID=320322 RepID=A0A9E7IGF2_9LILI|nr:hypothetical protein MUK42_15817 [Musa troglodytarum]
MRVERTHKNWAAYGPLLKSSEQLLHWSAMKEGTYPTSLIKNSIFLRNDSGERDNKFGDCLTADKNSASDHPKLLRSSPFASTVVLLALWRDLRSHMKL